MVYNNKCKAEVKPLKKGSEEMLELNVSEALLRAILELIEKCKTLEELKESVNRIVDK